MVFAGDIQAVDCEVGVEKLIQAARLGNSLAFSQLAEHYLPFLSREVGKYVPAHDIEDVVQETLIRMHRAIRTYEESGRFEHWARRIAGRASLDYWRTTRRKERLEKAVTAESLALADSVEGSASGLRKDLERCLASLSPEDRVVCIMAFLEEKTHREIAEVVGSTTVAVKVRCFRLKKKLREWFEV